MGDDEQTRLREIRRSDIPALIDLKREIFGERRASESDFAHKFFDSPWTQYTGLIAECGDTLAGVMGAVWRPLLVDEVERRSSQVCELMVRKEFRGTGIRQLISAELAARATDLGAIEYSFPNRASEPKKGISRSYWGEHADDRRTPFPVPAYLRVLRPGPLGPLLPDSSAAHWLGAAALQAAAHAPRLARQPSGLGIEVSRQLPDGLDELWKRCQTVGRIQTLRSEAYLRWRYEEHPRQNYSFLAARSGGELSGLAVIGQESVQGIYGMTLMDWLVPPGRAHVFDALVIHAEREARRAPDNAFVLAAALPQHAGRLVRLGFWRVPDRLTPVRMLFTCWRPRWPSPSFDAVCDPANWFLTLGDNDVF
jgi:hypothetical protein